MADNMIPEGWCVACIGGGAGEEEVEIIRAWIREKGLTQDDIKIVKPKDLNCVSVYTKKPVLIN